jgi:hypothetical protein
MGPARSFREPLKLVRFRNRQANARSRFERSFPNLSFSQVARSTARSCTWSHSQSVSQNTTFQNAATSGSRSKSPIRLTAPVNASSSATLDPPANGSTNRHGFRSLASSTSRTYGTRRRLPPG